MAIEQKRACGYRKAGGIYLVGGRNGVDCHRLPFALTVCKCCGAGFKFTRGNNWINPGSFFGQCPEAGGDRFASPHNCHGSPCSVCFPPTGKHLLLWVGASFYPSPADFVREGNEMGVSRRVRALPRDFVLGETIVYFAHIKGETNPEYEKAQKDIEFYKAKLADPVKFPWTDEEILRKLKPLEEVKELLPAVFMAFRPERVEKILTQGMATEEELKKCERLGITPVLVPDDDKDHAGDVHTDARKEATI
jgi:hypothetical protein